MVIFIVIYCVVLEQFVEEQHNIEALPGETVTLVTELPEPGLDVTWLKDNVPLSMSDEKYHTTNKDCFYELMIPQVTVEDCGEYKVQGGGHEFAVLLNVNGWSLIMFLQLNSLFLVFTHFVLNNANISHSCALQDKNITLN